MLKQTIPAIFLTAVSASIGHADPVQTGLDLELAVQIPIENDPVILGLDNLSISYTGEEKLSEISAYDDFCLYSPDENFQITVTGQKTANANQFFGLESSDDNVPLVAYKIAMSLSPEGLVDLEPGKTHQVTGFEVVTYDPSCVEEFMSLEISFPEGLEESLDSVSENYLTPGTLYTFSDTVTVLLEPGLG